ncbi:hypothetical protein M9Y10_031513 [Tritrichomonas musculus]|uniref:Uncharacterized protein n=1 Tax=Tritrichomonas musculus TaxID=1915356 RepID=A0ABR2H0Z5_9EUKA
MNPILSIIHYLFDKNSIENDDNTINSFFDNGLAFAQFVEISFQKKIPKIYRNPDTDYKRKRNNELAYEFVLKKNSEIEKFSPSFNTEQEKIKLLTLILTKQCFKIDYQDIFIKINMIFFNIDIKYDSLDDMVNLKCLFNLVNVLTENENEPDIETVDFELITKIFNIKNIPLVIDESSLSSGNRFVFFIQIQIIFDIYSSQVEEKINFSKEVFQEYENLQINEFKRKSSTDVHTDPSTSFDPQPEESRKNINQNKPQKINPMAKIQNKQKLTDDDLEELIAMAGRELNQEKKGGSPKKQVQEKKTKSPKNQPKSFKIDPENIDDFTDYLKEEGIIGDDNPNYNLKDQIDNSEINDGFDQLTNFNFNNNDSNSAAVAIVKEWGIDLNQPNKKKKSEVDKMIEEAQRQDDEMKRQKAENERLLQMEKIIKSDSQFNFDNDSLNDEALVKTINEIAKEEKLHFQILKQLNDQDYLPRFVRIFFNKEDYPNDYDTLTKIIEDDAKHYDKIDDILKFLATKDPIFNLLVFDFKRMKNYDSSIFTFCKNVLDCFFLTKNKKELLEMTSKIVFINEQKIGKVEKIKNDLDFEKNLLFNWETYCKLVYFAYNKNLNDFNDDKIKNIKYYFKSKDIPMIIDERYFNDLPCIELSIFYYQIQFIFDVIKREIKLNSLEKGDTYNKADLDVAKKCQEERYNQFTIYQESNFAGGFSLKKKKSKKKIEKVIKNDRENIQKPQKFLERVSKSSDVEDDDIENLDLSPDSYWDRIDNDESYAFENGVLFRLKKRRESLKSWNHIVSNYTKYITPNKTTKALFDSAPKSKQKSKLYKFFYYDEDDEKWKKNQASCDQFCRENRASSWKAKLSVVLFFNSSEDDLISINSRLISSSFPVLDDNQIYVYGICEKPLSGLKFELTSEKNDLIKPLFLLLHVPDSKKDLKDLKNIIYKIYYFLSMTCDIEIAVFNGEHYHEQLETLKEVNNLKVSYFDAYGSTSIQQDLDDLDLNPQAQKFFTSSLQFLDDKCESSDGDEDDSVKEQEFTTSVNTSSNDIFSKLSPANFKKETKYIILVNDDRIHDDFSVKDDGNTLFEYIIGQVQQDFCIVNFINVNDSLTYRDFLTSLQTFATTSNSDYNQVFDNFNNIEATEICRKYISIKSQSDYTSKLEKAISNRFNQLKQIERNKNLSNYEVMSKLKNELTLTYPSIDYDYKCISLKLIDKLNDKTNKDTGEDSFKELKKSSENYIGYLEKWIKSADFWPPEKKDYIKKSYNNFLKNELFDILNFFYPKTELMKEIAAKQNELATLIKSGIVKIDKLFDDFDKYVSENSTQKIVSLDETMKKATNYMIRETENVREIKVLVETGDLESQIPTDF